MLLPKPLKVYSSKELINYFQAVHGFDMRDLREVFVDDEKHPGSIMILPMDRFDDYDGITPELSAENEPLKKIMKVLKRLIGKKQSSIVVLIDE